MIIDKERWLILSFVLLHLSFSLLFSQTEDASRILEENKAGVISFVAYGENKEEISRGTGFVVSEGIMATSYHLVSSVALVEGKNFKGKKVKIEGIVAFNKNFDIALLKIKKKAPALNIGDSNDLETGKRVFALGSNESGDNIVSEGTVRNFLKLSAIHRIIDTSLAIPESFCGGPLLGLNGQVLGMIIFFDMRSKFALPINTLKLLNIRGRITKFKDWQHEDYLSTLEGAFFAGRIYALLEETGKAQKYLEKVVSIKPERIQAHALLASIYNKQRNHEKAISAYKKVIGLDENRDDAHYGLGLTYLKLRRYQDAILPLEKAVQLNVDNKDAYYHAGNAYEELKEFTKAADAYEKFLNLRPENLWTGYLRLGLSRMNMNDFESAITAFQRALEEKPQDIKTNYNLAQAYHKAGQYEKAEEVYKFLAQINPDDANVYYNTILRMYDEANRSEKAIEAAKKMIELNPESEMAVYNLGIMLMKLERYDEAIETFNQALAIRPDYDYAYYNIGFAYSKQKKYKESAEAFEKFVELVPDNADGWFNIGVGYMLQKKFDSALKPLQKCVELRPDYGLAHYNLAITYLNLKDNYSARQIYEKLITIDPDLAEKLNKILR